MFDRDVEEGKAVPSIYLVQVGASFYQNFDNLGVRTCDRKLK